MVCYHTAYFLYNNVSNNLIDVEHLSVRNDVADMSLATNNRVIGVMVLDMDFKVKRILNNCITHYIYILPKLRCKVFEHTLWLIYSKVMNLEYIIDYAVTRLIQDYTPSDYEEP